MPHVIVKLWPGKTERRKQNLADAISRSVTSILDCGDDAVSVAMEEVSPADWVAKIYEPDIMNRSGELYKKPGYGRPKGS